MEHKKTSQKLHFAKIRRCSPGNSRETIEYHYGKKHHNTYVTKSLTNKLIA